MLWLSICFIFASNALFPMNDKAGFFDDLNQKNKEETECIETIYKLSYSALIMNHVKSPYVKGNGLKVFTETMSKARVNLRQVYRIDDQLIGFFISFLVRTTKNKYNPNFFPLDGVLVMMAVHPKNRKKGHGKAIVEHVIEWAIEKKCPALWVGVSEKNDQALRLYQRCGFCFTGMYQNKDEIVGDKSIWLIKHLADTLMYQQLLKQKLNPDIAIRYNK